jgi:hypothetical protein
VVTAELRVSGGGGQLNLRAVLGDRDITEFENPGVV